MRHDRADAAPGTARSATRNPRRRTACAGGTGRPLQAGRPSLPARRTHGTNQPGIRVDARRRNNDRTAGFAPARGRRCPIASRSTRPIRAAARAAWHREHRSRATRDHAGDRRRSPIAVRPVHWLAGCARGTRRTPRSRSVPASNGIDAFDQNNFGVREAGRGTTGWQRYTITLPVAPGAEFVEVGAMIQGKGSPGSTTWSSRSPDAGAAAVGVGAAGAGCACGGGTRSRIVEYDVPARTSVEAAAGPVARSADREVPRVPERVRCAGAGDRDGAPSRGRVEGRGVAGSRIGRPTAFAQRRRLRDRAVSRRLPYGNMPARVVHRPRSHALETLRSGRHAARDTRCCRTTPCAIAGARSRIVAEVAATPLRTVVGE